ncbi:hypothetical protein DACRYDRAFT_104334 [Dacryopinax primogenitus]|uniref:NB-ARC domain-containing protein n=1 Tax=Dacryopinax primogenitus (strain DJM 731) TaxID=1858805 RepID=M5G6G3_DACPD|nr:uncharacterized protein DACRYDRAFT_104334 [Dacryopinax primogenitus]EJU05846.1 hypothetical protein DACRYDRAFT_104334 [Dacryopinax primogenitus]
MALSNDSNASTEEEETLPSKLAALKRAVNPILGKMADLALEALDIREELTENQAGLDALALRVAEVTEDILVKASAMQEGQLMQSQKFKRLQLCVDEISSFLREQAIPDIGRRMARIGELERIKAEVDTKNHRLTETLTAFIADISMDVLRAVTVTAAVGNPTIPQVARSTSLPITRLPPKLRIFRGREDVVKQIVSCLLRPDPGHIAILGMGGMGKTDTAATVLHHEDIKRKYGSNRVFVSCDGITTADGIISTLATALKSPSTQESDPTALLTHHLESVEGFVLLVLDNLESAWDTPDRTAVEELLTHLSNVLNLSLVITMRGTQGPMGVDWSQPLLPPLDALDSSTARQIYLANGGRSDDHLDELLQELDGWPLAVVLMAYQGQTQWPSQLLSAYRREQTALMSIRPGDRRTSVEVSISLSLQCQAVSDAFEALELLGLLCLLPDGMEEDILQTALPDMHNIPQSIRVLQHVSLVTRLEGGELKVLSPIRTYVLRVCAPSMRHRLTLEDFFIQHMQHILVLCGVEESSPDQSEDLVKVITKNFGNMLSVFSRAIDDPHIRQEILDAVHALCSAAIMIGYGDCPVLVKKAAGASSPFPEFKHTTGQLYLVLALYYSTSSRFDDAFKTIEQARNVDEAVHHIQQLLNGRLQEEEAEENIINALTEARDLFVARNLQYEAVFPPLCTQQLCLLALDAGRFEEAIELGMASKEAFEALSFPQGIYMFMQLLGWTLAAFAGFMKIENREVAATCQRILSEIHCRTGRFLEALDDCSLAEEAARIMDNEDSLWATRREQARLNALLGNLVEAEEQLSGAIRFFLQLGDKLKGAGCRLNLSFVLEARGMHDKAVDEIRSALRLCEDLKVDQAIALCKGFLGKAIAKPRPLTAASVAEAEQLFREALQVFDANDNLHHATSNLLNRTLDVNNTLGPQAFLRKDLVYLWREQDRHDGETLQRIQEALELFKKKDNRSEMAACYGIIASILADQGLRDEATSNVERAQCIYEELRFPPGQARCRMLLKQLADWGEPESVPERPEKRHSFIRKWLAPR